MRNLQCYNGLIPHRSFCQKVNRTHNMCRCMGENTVCSATRKGKNLGDEPQEARPVELDFNRLNQFVEEDSRSPTRQLAVELGSSHIIIDRHLKCTGRINYEKSSEWFESKYIHNCSHSTVLLFTFVISTIRLWNGFLKLSTTIKNNGSSSWQRGISLTKSKKLMRIAAVCLMI